MNRDSKDFLTQGSVCSSLSHMINDFCNYNALETPNECNLYDLDDRIPFNVWCNIINQVQNQFKTDALGLKIADFVKPSYAGIISYIAFSRSTLLEAIPDFIKYFRLAYDLNCIYFQIKDSEIEFCWDDHLGQPGLLIDECAIALFYNIVKQSIYPYKINPKCINFIYKPPKDIDFYKNYFNCPVYFNCTTTSIIVSLDSLMKIQLPQEDPYLYRILKSHADGLLEKLMHYNEFEIKIRSCITTNIRNKKINLEIISNQMGISQKKLRENLLDYGYTFNKILSDVRFKIAKKYLSDSDLNISEISFLLGYSEQSAFQRSFKSWSGLTPLKWRERNKTTKI